MKIPPDKIENARQCLREIVGERTSPWQTRQKGDPIDDEDSARDEQDYEDIEQLETVLDFLQWLRDRGGKNCFVEFWSCLDPLNGFNMEGKEWPDYEDEPAFRLYLTATYGISKDEFY